MSQTSYLEPRAFIMPPDNDCPKKHPCPDCRFCQWCGDDRCALCLKKGDGCRKLSQAEQIALYEAINSKKEQV